MSRALREQAVDRRAAPSELSCMTLDERENWTRLHKNKQPQEAPNGSVLPRSPLAAIIGLAALVLVSRSLFSVSKSQR